MSDIKGLLKNPRVIIFILILLGSLIAIHPSYTPGEGISTNLNFGLDLEGGSWLQIQLQVYLSRLMQIPENLSAELSSLIGA